MPWNWQLPDWPNFIFNTTSIADLERKFLKGAGGVFAILRHLDEEQRQGFIVEILSSEGMNSAEIEGEILERASLQSSIQRHFGLHSDRNKISDKEYGMGELLCRVYETYEEALTHSMLFEWHHLLMEGNSHISDIGKYRTHPDPMQIVSGRLDRRYVYYEAPPSSSVHDEMSRFIHWFNDSERELPALVRAAIAHLYFESIHPFEDGNGRIGRALVEKALSQQLRHPTLIAISEEIARQRKRYYAELAACNHTLEIGSWMRFFSEIILKAQANALELIHFLMAKSKLLHILHGKLNARQEKVLLRLFAEGPRGFKGGLSAENYIAITKTSRATATRDLIDLVNKGALVKRGELKSTRYYLVGLE